MIFLLAGHSSIKGTENYDPGAIANGYNESDLAIGLRDVTELSILKNNGKVMINDDRDYLKSFIQKTSHLNYSDVICDIHFNASTPVETGVEVFYPYRATQQELDLALIVSKKFSDIMGIKNNGIKDETQSSRKRLNIMNPKCINILIETCYITNVDDLNSFLNNVEILGETLAELLLNASSKARSLDNV